MIDHFDRVIIAPSTLSMLFIERQYLRVQQPSEVAKAERVRALINSGGLKLVSDDAETSAADAKEIGRDLAIMLSLAKRDGGLVVRSAPVSKLGTYLEEHVDMSGHAAVLTDTLSILDFLSNSARIDADTKQGAENYLRQVDKGWQASPPITADSKLFLDDLTVVYLDHVGLLDVLIRSVSAVFVHPDVEGRTQQTLSHGKQSAKLLNAIDRIRTVLNLALESGKVKFSARRMKVDDETFGTSPSLDIMSDLSGIDAVLADDRCLNKLPTWTDGLGNSAKAATTLEVLDELKSGKKLDEDGLWRARHKLRSAGYYAMPSRSDEIQHHLRSVPTEGTKIRETPELRAVRESIAFARINNAFLPSEMPWLNSFTFEVIKSLRALWARSTAEDDTEARSDWLLSILPNPLEWCLDPQNEAAWASARLQAIAQAGLLMVFVEGKSEQKRRYFAWLNEAFIKPLQQARPELWREIMPFLKSYMLRLLGPQSDSYDGLRKTFIQTTSGPAPSIFTRRPGGARSG